MKIKDISNKIAQIGGISTLVLSLSGCGWFESLYDESNYESITNERGDIEMYSGGKIVKKMEDIKIIYSNSDSQAIWFKKDGQIHYWQGDAYLKINSE